MDDTTRCMGLLTNLFHARFGPSLLQLATSATILTACGTTPLTGVSPTAIPTTTSPALSAFVAAGSHYALRATDGKLLWRSQVPGNARAPSIADETVYTASGNSIYALDTRSGVVHWQQQVDGPVWSVAIASGDLYVTTGYDKSASPSGSIYAVRAADGATLWRFHTGDAIMAAPAVANGAVYVGSADHSLYALRVNDGSILWIQDSPAQSHDIVYVGSDDGCDGCMYALNTSGGRLRWRYCTQKAILESPRVADDTVFAGSSDFFLYALRASDGKLLWRHQTGGAVSSPDVAAGVVYAGSQDGYTYVLNENDGSLRWRTRLPRAAPWWWVG